VKNFSLVQILESQQDFRDILADKHLLQTLAWGTRNKLFQVAARAKLHYEHQLLFGLEGMVK
jgi:hypothetical protein